MEEILDKFNAFTEKPVKFLAVQKDVKDDITSLVKSLYDLTKTEEIDGGKKKKGAALPKLIVKNFDEEQIWQQIDLQNSESWDQLVWNVANCMSGKKDLTFPVTVKGEEEVSEEDDEHNEESEDKQQIEEAVDKPRKIKKAQKSNLKKSGKSSIVDDKFFKLNEMEQFLLKEEREKKAASDSEDSIDLFDDVDDESGEEGAQGMYNDFFDGDDDANEDEQDDDSDNDLENRDHDDREVDEEEYAAVKEKKSKKKGKKVTFAGMDASESESDESAIENDEPNTQKDINKDEKKSDFEYRQDRLKQTIDRLEDKMLKDAPWQLKGEVDALKRPQNSLLEEVVDFDLTSRPPPIITEQTTLTLEDIIRQRIKDKAWDDVEKKEKPVDDQLQYRKTEILDQSKSKLSLAQVYEAEYLKQKQAASGEKEEEQEPEAHKEVKGAMTKLFAKLDALCHYHYTPRAPQAEVKIVSNTPAISMEEVAPVASSDAALLAPEEVKKKRRGDLMSKEERSSTDKKRERRKKKQLQRKKGTVAKVTEHRNTTKGVESNDKSLKTSKAFFQQLNDEATSLIKKKRKNKGQ